MGLLRRIIIVATAALLLSGGAVAQEEFDAERNEILRQRIKLNYAREMLKFYKQEEKRILAAGERLYNEYGQRLDDSGCKDAPAIETSEQFRRRTEACARLQAYVELVLNPGHLALHRRFTECTEAINQHSNAIERIQRELDEAIVTYMTQVAWQAIQAGQVRQPTLPPIGTKGTKGAQPGKIRRPPAVKSRPPVRQAKPGVRRPPSRSPWEGAAEAVRRGLPTAIGGSQIRVR
jgi:hypothetical protein